MNQNSPSGRTSPLAMIEADPRWGHVVNRDRSADGTFVYAVITTGIFCRPSCASRRALPHNLRFFDGPEAAQAAGFRPCQRCEPLGPGLAHKHAEIITRACRSICAAETPPSLNELASEAGLSPAHFHRLFKVTTGVTPKGWAAAQRNHRMRQALETGAVSVTSAIYDAGFNASSRFYEQSSDALGMTPTDFRQGGRHARIRFAIAQTSLGALLVAQSDKGICEIALADQPETLLKALQDHFPKAELIGADAAFEARVAQVATLVEAPAQALDLPLDIQGTAFQQRVWQALRQIPPGTTASYSDIARAIGAPRAVRAVAQACAANRLAIAIPCHRVLRQDGQLSGYRWGIDRKRTLLLRESPA